MQGYAHGQVPSWDPCDTVTGSSTGLHFTWRDGLPSPLLIVTVRGQLSSTPPHPALGSRGDPWPFGA